MTNEQEASGAYAKMKGKVDEEVKRFFRPEFLNRIDGQLVFHALSKEHIVSIVDLMLNEVRKPMLEKGLSLEVTDAAKAWLGEKGYDPTFGARPLRRVIEKNIEDQLSDGVLSGTYSPGDTVFVDVDVEGDTLTVGLAVEVAATQ
jgi:ATP-dependent Clp protease ATP-binding subunit ClpC